MKRFAALLLILLLAVPATAVCCNLDVDDNGQATALTDGLLALRYAQGLRGQALVAGAVAPDAGRKKPKVIVNYLNDCAIDADGNGVARENDALIVLRYLFGFTGEILGELAEADCQRCTGETIKLYLDALEP